MATMTSAVSFTCKTSFLGHGIPSKKLTTEMGIFFLNQKASKNSSSLIIECSSRPRKKATAHHAKTRPKKHQPYDKNRKGPTKYPPLDRPPPVWLLTAADFNFQQKSATVEQISSPDEETSTPAS